jgi:hypothetical protein
VPASRGGQRRPPHRHLLVFGEKESSANFLQDILGLDSGAVGRGSAAPPAFSMLSRLIVHQALGKRRHCFLQAALASLGHGLKFPGRLGQFLNMFRAVAADDHQADRLA